MKPPQQGNIALIIAIILLVAAAAGWVYIQPTVNKNESKNTEQNPTPSPLTTLVPDLPSDWISLNNLKYSLKHPPSANGDARKSESVVTFMGQKQIDSGRTQTELFDGYAFRIGIVDDAKDTLEETAKRERQNAVDNCSYNDGQISELQASTIDGKPSFQYAAKNCYIDYTESFVLHNGVTYRISESYAGDEEDQKKYQLITDQIRSSLHFK